MFRFSHDFSKFLNIYSTLVNNYSGDIEMSSLEEAAIAGITQSVGDVYTNYVDTDDALEFNESISGNYEGIGCTIAQTQDKIVVYDVYEDSPADKAGLKAEDIIISVDGKNALELGVTKLSDYIKKDASNVIKMIVKREEDEITLELHKGSVSMPVADSIVLDYDNKKIGYIGITLFSSDSYSQFKRELDEVEKEKINGLIIDVRNNSGGYLNCVSDILSELLPKGEIIYKMEKDGKITTVKDKTKNMREYPIAVLVNSGSASASEILAGSIKESYHGYVVGTTTYGKGTVQQVKKLKDGSMLKYTIENWLTPLGNWINEVGVKPTDEVELSDEYYKNPIKDNDNQLQKALSLVSK